MVICGSIHDFSAIASSKGAPDRKRDRFWDEANRAVAQGAIYASRVEASSRAHVRGRDRAAKRAVRDSTVWGLRLVVERVVPAGPKPHLAALGAPKVFPGPGRDLARREQLVGGEVRDGVREDVSDGVQPRIPWQA